MERAMKRPRAAASPLCGAWATVGPEERPGDMTGTAAGNHAFGEV